MGNRLKIALIASLVLNVFLIGLGVGVGLVRARLAHDLAQAAPGGTLWNAAEALAPADRDAFRAMLRQRALEVRPTLRQARQARREAARLISAPVYDAKAVSAALARARADEATARGQVDAGLTAYVGRLSADQRADLADAVAHGRLGPAARAAVVPPPRSP